MGIKNWNSNSLPSIHIGKAMTEIYGGWVNYKKADGAWSAIDCLLVQDGTGFHVTKAPFTFDAPLLSDGEAVFNSNNRYDIFNKTDITADPFSQTIKALGVNSVSGELYDINGDGRLDAVRYPDAYGVGIHLIFYVEHGVAPRLKKLVQFDQALPVDTEYEFEVTYSGRAEISPRRLPEGRTRRQHRDDTDVLLNTPQRVPHDEGFYIRKHNESQKRGIGIKTPLIWDSDGKAEEIDLDIRKGVGANTYILTKYIKASFFTGVTYPVFTDTTSTFYPDANPETTSVDGYAERSVGTPESFATLTSSVGTTANDSNTSLNARLIRSNTVGNLYGTCMKGVSSYDTSALGADNIDSGDLDFYIGVATDTTGTGEAMGIVGCTTVSDTAVGIADYLTHDSTRLVADIAISSLTVGAGRQVFPLITAGLAYIKGTGITKFGLSLASVIDNIDPVYAQNTEANISLFTKEQIEVAWPKLILVHSVAANDNITVGVATAVANGTTSIDVSMPYTDDDNANSTYTVDYKLSEDASYTNWVTGSANTPTPYTDTITGLLNGRTYDVKMTYNDADGVTGTNPQTVTGVLLTWVESGVSAFRRFMTLFSKRHTMELKTSRRTMTNKSKRNTFEV